MINKAIDIADMREKSYIWLGVWKRKHKAISFYKKHGFYVIGIHPFIMGDIYVTLCKLLFLFVLRKASQIIVFPFGKAGQMPLIIISRIDIMVACTATSIMHNVYIFKLFMSGSG